MIGALSAALVIVGGTLCDGSGAACVTGKAVVIQGDRIHAILDADQVRKNPPTPAKWIDATGKTITPGFIDLNTGLGLNEIRLVRDTVDTDTGATRWIRAAYRVQDSYNPYSVVIPIQRAAGITTAVSMATGGLISGVAAAHDLDTSRALLAESLVVRLGGLKVGARGDRFAALRAVVKDARHFARRPKDFLGTSFRRSRASRLDLERLDAALKRPIFVFVDRRADIENVVDWARSEGLSIVLVGAREAWQCAALLAESPKVPVVIDPTANLPASFDGIHTRADNLALLNAAGVPVSISSFSTHLARRLRQWAGNAVRDGLTHGQALRAVTSAPAEAIGLPNRGLLKPGYVANVVLWSDDPFELSTFAERVIISGVLQSTKTRQSALLERYRTLPGVSRAGAMRPPESPNVLP